MADFPSGTAPLIETKLTTRDAGSNTDAYWNGADANNVKTVVDACKAMLAGSYRGWVSRNTSGNLTGVTIHTVSALVNGYRKTFAPTVVTIDGTTGTYYVGLHGNAATADMTTWTAASEPSPYATSTRQFPLASLEVTGGDMTISHIRPDWVIGGVGAT